MKQWPVQDAKAQFSAFLRAAMKEGPQAVTLRGQEAAVLVSAAEWRRLSAAQPSAKELLLADEPRFEFS